LSERWWRRRKRRLTWFSDLKDDTDRQARNQNRKPNCPNASDCPNSKSETNSHLSKAEPLKVNFQKPRLPEDPEPLVDVIEEHDAIVVVAGLLGVRKEDLQIHAAHCSLTISSDTSEHKYYRELALPAATVPETAVATFKNGVLQVRLKKLVVDAQPLTE
jgi:HSP20 family molecular chaperone IbpA